MEQSVQEESVIWAPNPGPQEALIACPIPEIFFGGARGASKTVGAILDFGSHADTYGQHAKGLLFRRTYPELEEVESQCAEIYPHMGATYSPGRRRWTWPSGATIRLRAMQRDADATKYMGFSITWLCIEEAGNWPSPKPLDKLRAILRSPHGIPTRLLLTGNPGGVGHNWLKARYYDPAPAYTPIWDEETKAFRVFIAGTLDDNPHLALNDPGYENRLIASAGGDEALLRAWRYGDWNIVSGGLFDDLWRPAHVIEPFKIPAEWHCDRSLDWGSSSPFAVLWWAESNGETAPNGICYPKGWLFLFAEWYGWNGKPNEGCKMLARDVARGIVEREKKFGVKIRPGPADTNIWVEGGGRSEADDFVKEGVRWERAIKGPGSRVAGWNLFRKRLVATNEFNNVPPGETPGISVFSTCRQFIRTVPTLPRDPDNRDDADTDAEDHIADAARYRIVWKRGRFGVSEVLI